MGFRLRAASFLGGVLGAVVMSLSFAVARVLLLTPMNIEISLGARLGTGWQIGFVLHLMIGGCFGLVYCAIFGHLGKTGAATGAALGALHGLLAGVALAVISLYPPLLPARTMAPGFLGRDLGVFTPILLVGTHLVFGAVVGTVHQYFLLQEAERVIASYRRAA